MRELDINTWNRKQHFEHFMSLKDASFAITFKVDVTKAYQFSKVNNVSFFGKYLHATMRAINSIENFKYRIIDNKVVVYDVIHASATIMREDTTFGFSYIKYSENLEVFLNNLNAEKERILNSTDLFAPIEAEDCIHCSALPWVAFIGHKEPVSGKVESVPELAFSKVEQINDKRMMTVALKVNHALVDGYHVGQFSEKFQEFLNQ